MDFLTQTKKTLLKRILIAYKFKTSNPDPRWITGNQ